MTLADSFLDHQSPAVLIDLTFDAGEINISTRSTDLVHGGKTYRPLSGITGGLSIGQSLGNPALEASVQLTGQSQEFLSIALTEPFQLRDAKICLGNLDSAGTAVEEAEVVFSGKIANMPIVQKPEGIEISINLESIFADFRRPLDIRFSSGDQKTRIDPDDTIFDQVESTKVQTPAFGGG